MEHLERQKERKGAYKKEKDPDSRAQPPRSGDCAQVLAQFPSEGGTEVDYQVAAPTESSTPTMHRAKIAQQRVRMEGWRQERLGSRAGTHREEEKKTSLQEEKEKKQKNTLDSYRPSHGRCNRFGRVNAVTHFGN